MLCFSLRRSVRALNQAIVILSCWASFLSIARAAGDTLSGRKFVIITDMEPDDRRAIELIGFALSGQRSVGIGMFIVNTLNADARAIDLRAQLEGLGLGDVPVFASDNRAPESYERFSGSAAALSYQGYGAGAPTTGRFNQAVEALISYISLNSGVELIVIADPSEVTEALTRRPELRRNIGRIHMMGGWVVGGDNVLRTTYNWNMAGPSAQALLAMQDVRIRLFSSHIIKPSFGGGSVNSQNFPDIWAAIDAAAQNVPGMLRTAEKSGTWDAHLVQQIPPLAAVIGPHIGHQFTPADPILIASLLDPAVISGSQVASVSIDLGNKTAAGYAVTVTNQAGANVEIVNAVSPAAFARVLVDAYTKLPAAVSLNKQFATQRSVQRCVSGPR